MGLQTSLTKYRATIVKMWFQHVVDTYHADTARFLKSQKDPFANPVGNTTHKGLEAIFDHLLADTVTPDSITPLLDPIIRIRAVQAFSPSQATGFIFALKKIIRTSLGGSAAESSAELSRLDARIDALMLMAFDIYMHCREKIYELKANESRNRMFKAFERAGLVQEDPENNRDL